MERFEVPINIIHIEDSDDWQMIVKDTVEQSSLTIGKFCSAPSIEAAMKILQEVDGPAIAIVDLRLSDEPAYKGLEWLVFHAQTILQEVNDVFVVSGFIPPEIHSLLVRVGIAENHIFHKGLDWDETLFTNVLKKSVEHLVARSKEIDSLRASLSETEDIDTSRYVFISYSHKDSDYVHKLAKEINSLGMTSWIDDRIDYGTQWPHVIQEKLDQCSALIIVMSSNSYYSTWVQNELSRAIRLGKPIFPLLLEGNEPWLSVETIQYVDVRNSRLPPPRFYRNLFNCIRKASV